MTIIFASKRCCEKITLFENRIEDNSGDGNSRERLLLTEKSPRTKKRI